MTQRGMTATAGVLIILNLSLIALTGWKIWDYNQPKPVVPQVQAPVELSQTITSSQGSFSITFPAGWDAVMRVMDSDRFVVDGSRQPLANKDVAADIKDVAYFDTDGPVVFEAAIDDDFAAPQGEANDLLIGKDKYLLSGRKYVHTYVGMDVGSQRSNGDKDYVYSFSVGGKRELRVTYRVYAADNVDNVKVVDTIVRSIRKLK